MRCTSCHYYCSLIIYFRIIIAATFGSMIAGQALSFTPDYISAKVSAGRLFKLFDTQSNIDVNQPGGKIKVTYLFIEKMFFYFL